MPLIHSTVGQSSQSLADAIDPQQWVKALCHSQMPSIHSTVGQSSQSLADVIDPQQSGSKLSVIHRCH
eukprot:scaffold25521_cov22-Tisochrysis_lutea.AAC.3